MAVTDAITNDRLGERLGVSHAMASRLRNGRRLPSIKVMDAIHREFGVSIDALHQAYLQGPAEFGQVLRSAIGDAAGDAPSQRAA